MSVQLASLEQKVEQILALCESLRAENHRLRDHVEAIEREKQALVERITAARTRLEGLVDKLPQE